MGRTASTEPQCLYKGTIYFYKLAGKCIASVFRVVQEEVTWWLHYKTPAHVYQFTRRNIPYVRSSLWFLEIECS